MKDKRLIILSVVFFMLCTGCKAPIKTQSNEQAKLDFEIKNDIKEEKRDSTFFFSVSEILRIINEYLSVRVKEVNYDTSKPIDLSTGKPPVLSEKETEITGKKEISEKESAAAKNDSSSASTMQDNSTIAGNADVEIATKSDVAQDPYKYRYIFGIIILVVSVVVICWKKVSTFIKKMF